MSFKFISLNTNVENAVSNTTTTASSFARREVLLSVFYLQQNEPKRNCGKRN